MIGADVVYLTLNRDGSVRSIEPFLTGFLKTTTSSAARSTCRS
jgi:hypothetical protein